MFSLTKKLYGNYLYWLNILYWKFFHLTLKNRVCREIFHCIEYIFYHSGILSNLRLSWKTEFALKFFTVGPIEYTFTFRSFEQLAPALKNSLSWINWIEHIFFPFRIFEQVVLSLKTELPWTFSLYWYNFIIQDFWANCACPESRVYPEFTVLNIYFLSFRIFEQLRLALKFFTVLKYFLSLRILSNLRLPWKQSCAEIFYCIDIFFIIRDFWATCACPENFHWIEIFFIIQDFWATCACPENRIGLKFYTVLI